MSEGWRTVLYESMPNKTVAAQVIGNLVFPWSLSCYALSGQELFRLELVCRACVQSVSAAVTFRRWLVKYEAGRGSVFLCTASLYVEYHAAHLQRVFLRRVRQYSTSVVIAGSFPASMYMETLGRAEWRPDDIDIFLMNEALVEVLHHDYLETVLLPLGLILQSTKGKTSYRDPCDTDTRERVSIEDFDDLMYLEDSVTMWIDHFLQHICHGHPQIEYAGLKMMREDLEVLLHNTAAHVPRKLHAPDYYVLQSRRLEPRRAKAGPVQANSSFLPTSLLPINIIMIQPCEPAIPNDDFPAFVCRNFDITLCSVALTVHDDLQYSFVEYDSAFRALRARKIVLRDRAFSCVPRFVGTQMSRITKYLMRGFRW